MAERYIMMNYSRNNPIQVYKTVPSLESLSPYLTDVKYCLFDLDGTLFNTEVLHAKCLNDFFSRYSNINQSLSVDDLQKKFMGLTERMLFDRLNTESLIDPAITFDFFLNVRNSLALEKIKSYDANLIDPSMLLLLKDLREAGYLMSIVSSAEQVFIDAILSKYNLLGYFEFILSRESTSKNKPDPMPYLLALKQTGLLSSQVIVFEDSKVGMTSAISAGLNTVQACWYN
jgi:beta-phosphoglucomutase-like phosphatase (HAD superfamily)